MKCKISLRSEVEGIKAQMRTAPKPTTILGRRCRVLVRLDKGSRTKGRGSPLLSPPKGALYCPPPPECPVQVATKLIKNFGGEDRIA